MSGMRLVWIVGALLVGAAAALLFTGRPERTASAPTLTSTPAPTVPANATATAPANATATAPAAPAAPAA
ncbi:MAG: hypothetical protein ACKOF7_08305, partial [Phycisphaerales bacterium]